VAPVEVAPGAGPPVAALASGALALPATSAGAGTAAEARAPARAASRGREGAAALVLAGMAVLNWDGGPAVFVVLAACRARAG
jgi:hypothetical protein